MGQNGGAIFLTVYILIISTICFVPLLNELYIGKLTKKECIGAYKSINPKFKYFGALNPITATLIASFYVVVGGWIINYIIKSLLSYKITDYDEYFTSFRYFIISLEPNAYPILLPAKDIDFDIVLTTSRLSYLSRRVRAVSAPKST